MTKKKKGKSQPTEEQVKSYEMLFPILQKLLLETKELSKKKPDNPLNIMKVQMINKVLIQIKDLLVNDPSVQFLVLLDNETLPSNSDAVFIIAQYEAALEQYESKHYRYDDELYKKRWFTSG